MDFKKELVKLLSAVTKLKEIENLISIPPDPKLGDYAFPCFKLGKNAKQEAENLKKKITLPEFVEKIAVTGPYLNFFINKTVLSKQTLEKIQKDKEDYGSSKSKQKIVIEFCGPNTNKPLHLGHIRNMALGKSMCNILSFSGKKVHPVNIVNNRGIHICQSMLAYQKWGKNKDPDKKGDHFVGDYYVMFAQKVKKNEDLKLEAQEMLLKWEREDKETIKLWKKMNKWVLDGFNETYQRFGVKFDKEYFESEYYQDGKKLVLEGLKKNIFVKNHEEMVIAELEKYKIPDKVLLRGDGTSVYMTQDMHLADLRYKDYKFDQMIYVVASEQQLHFKQLFKILQLLDKKYAPKMYHLSYGLVNLPSGRMKSREGTVVDADDLMSEVAGLAETEIHKRYGDMDKKEVKFRSEFIGIGAIKFLMLKSDASKDTIFNPQESVSFEGETGPYLQYTHARACSILRKIKNIEKVKDFSLLREKEEFELIKQLYNFPERVKETVKHYKPHIICRYLLDLAQSFNEFYHTHQVISQSKDLMNARLMLVDAVRQVLSNGLSLLDIHAPEEM
jgi:arginyl-tRNA synthetase